MNFNKVVLCGRLGKDPDLRFTPNGSAVSNFSMAISNYVKKDDGGFDENTVWIDVTCWGKTAERVAEMGKPGTEVLVEGRIDTRNWEDKDGKTQYRTFVNANSVQAGQNRNKTNQEEAGDQNKKPADAEKPADAGNKKAEDDDDLPF